MLEYDSRRRQALSLIFGHYYMDFVVIVGTLERESDVGAVSKAQRTSLHIVEGYVGWGYLRKINKTLFFSISLACSYGELTS
jgi:hypothetical protein